MEDEPLINPRDPESEPESPDQNEYHFASRHIPIPVLTDKSQAGAGFHSGTSSIPTPVVPIPSHGPPGVSDQREKTPLEASQSTIHSFPSLTPFNTQDTPSYIHISTLARTSPSTDATMMSDGSRGERGQGSDQDGFGRLSMIWPANSQAPSFDGTRATEKLEWFEKATKLMKMNDTIRHEMFQYYCAPNVYPAVAAIAKSVEKSKTPWEDMKRMIKENWEYLDPKQISDPMETLEMWFEQTISPDTNSVRGAIQEFETCLLDAGKSNMSTDYTFRFFRHLPSELQRRYLDRANKGHREIRNEPYKNVARVVSNILSELEDKGRGPREEYRSRMTAPTYHRGSPTVALDGSEARDYPPSLKAPRVGLEDSKIEELCRAVEALEIKLGQVQEPQVQRYNTRLRALPDQSLPPAKTQLQQLTEAYESYHSTQEQEIGDVREELAMNYQSGGRSGFKRSEGTGVCRYCGGKHMIAECKDFMDDVGEGICHYDQREAKFYIGKSTETTRRPLAAVLVLKYRATGELRSLVWSYHERYPDSPSNAGIKRQKARGVVVTTGTKYLTYSDGAPNDPIRPTSGLAKEKPGPGVPLPLEEGSVVASNLERVSINFARVYEGDRPLISYDSDVERHFRQLRTYSHSAENPQEIDVLAQKRGLPEIVVQTPTGSDQTPPTAKRTRTKGPEPPLPEPTRMAPTDISALDGEAVNELMDELATKILDTRMAITPQHLFTLNPTFTSALVAKIQNVRDKVATTVYLDDSGKTTKAPKNNKEYKTSAAVLEIGDEGELEIRGEGLRTNFLKRDGEPTRVGALPRLSCSIGPNRGEFPTKAILDTGSEINSISYAFAERTGVALMDSIATSKSYHGTTVTFRGEVKEKIWVGGHSLYLHFFVMPPDQPCEDVLLGVPFIKDSQMCIEHHPETGSIRANMIFGNTRLVVPVHDKRQSTRSDQAGN